MIQNAHMVSGEMRMVVWPSGLRCCVLGTSHFDGVGSNPTTANTSSLHFFTTLTFSM